MFITPERIGHSKTRDIASLMRTAVRANKQTQVGKEEVKRKKTERGYLQGPLK